MNIQINSSYTDFGRNNKKTLSVSRYSVEDYALHEDSAIKNKNVKNDKG